jgi:hypothetical protein
MPVLVAAERAPLRQQLLPVMVGRAVIRGVAAEVVEQPLTQELLDRVEWEAMALSS